ncbi:MAG TPA: T9SS type A sorting domain-containing protein [Bacteroidia bacterium]|jgi:hypothetical protein|nr:T9SS type A sorting domain-containing protein [Bacteroidia bacterium]
MKKLSLILFLLSSGFIHGQSWDWARKSGKNRFDYGQSIATDAMGNVFATGCFKSDTIRFGNFVLTNSSPDTNDIFLVKYDTHGNVRWAVHGGGTCEDVCNAVCTDAYGNCYITGYFESSRVVFGNDTLTRSDSIPYAAAIFIVKYDSLGNAQWARSATTYGYGFCEGNSICVDGTGNIVITGIVANSNAVFGTDTLHLIGSGDILLAKYDSSGNVMWVTSAGGSGSETGKSLSSDEYGNLYITGYFYDPILPIGNSVLHESSNGTYNDIFIAKFDSSGNPLWAKGYGGYYMDQGYSISASPGGGCLATGFFSSSNITFDTITLHNPGTTAVYTVRLDSAGNAMWAKCGTGSMNSDCGYATGIDGSGNCYVCGSFASPVITFGSISLANGGNINMFIIKYDMNGNELWALGSGGTYIDAAFGMNVDAQGNCILTGEYINVAIMFGNDTLTNSGMSDVFVAKLNKDNLITSLVQNKEGGLTWSVFPSPNNGTFTINVGDNNSTENFQLDIVDVMGRIVHSEKCSGSSSYAITIDVPPGVYFAHMTGERVKGVKSFIVK